jgi:hypothetical protein
MRCRYECLTATMGLEGILQSIELYSTSLVLLGEQLQ